MVRKLKWGIIATGRIAHTFAQGLAESQTGDLVAVASRTRESADSFGDTYGVERRYAGYANLLADPEVDAVYIATPHPMHLEWAVASAEAGKHILCEKPLGIDREQALTIIEAARKYDVFLMEAFMYRCHPQTAKILELIREGAVGEIRVIQANFSYNVEPDLDDSVLNPALAGGGILDVGCYCTSAARLIAGAATGCHVAEPVEFSAYGLVGKTTQVDEYTVAIAKFPGEIVAQLGTGTRVDQDNSVRIYGSAGSLHVPEPWQPGRNDRKPLIHLQKKDSETVETMEVASERDVYTLEADTVAMSIDNRQPHPPATTWDDTLGNMAMIDRWREAIGLSYDL